MIKIRKDLAVVCAFITLSGAEALASQPTNGMIYNTKENSALVYHCRQLSIDKITCQITQTAVRFKLSQTELQQSLDQERRNFIKNKIKPEGVDCKIAQDLRDVLTGKVPQPNGAQIDALNPKAKASLEAMISASLRFCESPSLDNYMSFVLINLDIQTKICLVSSYTFTQVLSKSASGAWTVIPEKTGDCGLVQLDRFEPEVSSGITFWNYISRKAVTNPSGKFGFGASCSSLDQSEHHYSWKKRNLDLACENVEFSPL